MAVVNCLIGIGIYSPPQDEYGNSVRGINACIDLAEEFGLHAFELPNAGAGLMKPLKELFPHCAASGQPDR